MSDRKIHKLSEREREIE